MCYVTDADWQRRKFYPGNKLILKLKEEVIGEGQIILVEKVTLATVTPYDAIVGGYENVDALRKDSWKTIVGEVKKPEEVEFFRILFRWL